LPSCVGANAFQTASGQPDASDPLRDETGILAGCHTALRAATAAEQELAGPLAGVCSLNSNLTGRPVFFCRTVARSAVYPLAATSSTLIATTSQPRSLLSIAKLNMARSRARPSIWSFVRIDQTCLDPNGGFAPVTLPKALVSGSRLLDLAWSYSSVTEDEEHVALARASEAGQLWGHGLALGPVTSERRQ
jgi:hypothetical protein